MTNNIDKAVKLNDLIAALQEMDELESQFHDYMDLAQNGPSTYELEKYIRNRKDELGELSIVNLTQHQFTGDQKLGFVKIHETTDEVKDLITFEELPTLDEMVMRARRLAYLASRTEAKFAMIGGAPYFQSVLAKHLKSKGICPLFAFSKREVVEKQLPDGSVKKDVLFKHLGWVQG